MAPAARRPTPLCALRMGAALLLLLPAACAQGPAGVGCSQNTNRSCEECLRNVSCLWCNTNKACLDYPVRTILPPASLCQLSSARWGVCWVNFEALIITMSVLGGSVLLGIVICCCCCCRRKKSRGPDKSDERAMREQEERRVRQEERRAEMKSRHDEIRKNTFQMGVDRGPSDICTPVNTDSRDFVKECGMGEGLFKEQNPYEKF